MFLNVLPMGSPTIIFSRIPDSNISNEEILKHTKIYGGLHPHQEYYALDDEHTDEFNQTAIQYVKSIEPYNIDSMAPDNLNQPFWIVPYTKCCKNTAKTMHEVYDRGAIYIKYESSKLSSGIKWDDEISQQKGQYATIRGFSELEIISKSGNLEDLCSVVELNNAIIGDYEYDKSFYDTSGGKHLVERLFAKDIQEHIETINKNSKGLNVDAISLSPIYLTTKNNSLDLSAVIYDRLNQKLIPNPNISTIIKKLQSEEICDLSLAVSYWIGSLGSEINLDGIAKSIPLKPFKKQI